MLERKSGLYFFYMHVHTELRIDEPASKDANRERGFVSKINTPVIMICSSTGSSSDQISVQKTARNIQKSDSALFQGSEIGRWIR